MTLTHRKYAPPKRHLTKEQIETMLVLYGIGVPKTALRKRFKLHSNAQEYYMGCARQFTNQEFFEYINGTLDLQEFLDEYYEIWNLMYPDTTEVEIPIPQVPSPVHWPSLRVLNNPNNHTGELR